MNFLRISSRYYCGIDLHGRRLYVCVMDQAGDVLLHRPMTNDFSSLLNHLKPYLGELIIGVESTYNWYWLSDCCQEAGIPFYLGHALYMRAVHGGKKKNDKIDSKTIADLLRSGMFPGAYVYPEEMRSTRDLLRRRQHYVSIRSGCYNHIQCAANQQGIFDITSRDTRRKSERRQLIERFDDVDVALSIESDLDMIDNCDVIIARIEQQALEQANHHDPRALELLQSISGVGNILGLTMLYEIHEIKRFPSVQCFSSYSRTVKAEHTSDGKPVKAANGQHKIGNPYLKWAFDQIIIHAQQTSDNIRQYYDRLKSKFGKSKGRQRMSHKYAITAYYMLKNGEKFDETTFLGQS